MSSRINYVKGTEICEKQITADSPVTSLFFLSFAVFCCSASFAPVKLKELISSGSEPSHVAQLINTMSRLQLVQRSGLGMEQGVCACVCVFLFPIFGHTKMRVVAINSGLREAVPCDPACFQMAGRVSPPLPHRGEGFASPPLAANLARVLHVLPSGAGLAPLPVS